MRTAAHGARRHARLRRVSERRERRVPDTRPRPIDALATWRRPRASLARLRGHGRRLPPPHGPRHRRHARRGRPRVARRRTAMAALLEGGTPRRRRAQRRRRTASSWSVWTMIKCLTQSGDGPCRLRSCWRGFRPAHPDESAGAPGQLRAAAGARRHHHGRQRPLGGAAPSAARRGASRRHRRGARHGRDRRAARHPAC